MISLRSLAPVALLLATPFAAVTAAQTTASPTANGGPPTLIDKVRATRLGLGRKPGWELRRLEYASHLRPPTGELT
jgi:hypothetical protein